MENPVSVAAARRLRPNAPFHLSPGAQPLGTTVTLTIDNCGDQPEIHLTDRRRNYTWRVMMQPDGDNTWSAAVKLPDEMTIVDYTFQAGGRHIQEVRQVEGENKPIYGAWTALPFKIAVYDPHRMPAAWTKGMVVYQIFPDRFAKAQSDEAARAAMKGVYGHVPLFQAWGATPESPPLGRDFFGGDLRGVIDKLDYLHDLGVECIYFNPIFEATANHRYEAIDFMKIDGMLGTEADFDDLIAGAHERGIKIVLDGVFNHCSSDSVYFDITNKYGNGAYHSQESPYYRWFRFEEWPEKFDGWMGHGFMPEFVECPEMIDYFQEVTAHWLRKGIDGWRLDVAFDNTEYFWRQFRKAVDEARPEAWTISEMWRDSTHYMLGDQFNGTMNYRFAWAVRGFLGTDDLTASEFDDRLQVWMRDTPPPALRSQMNMLDSHDTDRIMTICKGDRSRYKQMFAFHLAYVGAPLIYYGSETGLPGAFAEDGRRTMPWDALDEDLLAYLKKLMTYRKDSELLKLGAVETVLIDDEKRLYGFVRRHDSQVLYALFNARDEAAPVSLEVAGHWTDVLGNGPTIDGKLSFTLQARSAVWYVNG